MMDPAEDDDVKLVRASSELVTDIHALLTRILWKKTAKDERRKVHRVAKERDLTRLLSKIEPFQEDPQLLDTHLKNIIPELVAAYLDSLKHHLNDPPKSGNLNISSAIGILLYTYCKVRGEKVIVGFFNNEPRYVEPILSAMERAAQDTENVLEERGKNQVLWQERYVLLLWLSHLLLAPFDLASISTLEAETTGEIKDLALPPNLPGIPKRIIPICLKYIRTATRERKAAAALMVRMSLRPDMRGLGLLEGLAHWGISYFDSPVFRHSPILYESLGMLQFLSGLVASGNKEEIGRFAPKIFYTCQAIIQDDAHKYLQSSAIARKLVVKIFRNVAVLAMQSVDGLDAAEVMEGVIGFLLDSVADGDSPVRTSSSKALSVITLQLDWSMAHEVLETILGSMTEDVLWEERARDLSAVNPLRWHGLTLTLSQLLYRRALPAESLPEIINALLLALTFEQRSSTRSLIGTNVRDAANFGIWAISRRYTTDELFTVKTSAIRASHQGNQELSVMQMLALELLQSACLDPIGNIRRGSSAALQELIGRHPDTVVQGIPLVQIVDYHAVGLRERAICTVAFEASKLDRLYWDAMFDALQGWRGIGATDSPSRLFAAEAIGFLSTLKDFANVQEMVNAILTRLSKTGHREVEERHGLLLSLSTMITQVVAAQQAATHQTPELRHQISQSLADLSFIVGLDFMKILPSDPEFYRSPTLRPDLTASAVLALIRSICSAETEYLKFTHNHHGVSSLGDMLPLLELCLRRSETSVLSRIPLTVKGFVLIGLASPAVIQTTAAGWLDQLLQHSQTSNRLPGLVHALGVVYSILAARNLDTETILQALVARCTEGQIDSRVIALQSLEIVLKDMPKGCEAYDSTLKAIAEVLIQALNDYTINERGDVGSLVRLEALSVASIMAGPLHEAWNPQIQAYVLRLSLEKLDKVRLKAATSDANITPSKLISVHEVSTVSWFAAALAKLNYDSANALQRQRLQLAVVTGYCSSAGMGSETILRRSRAAFGNIEVHLRTGEPAPSVQFQFLETLVELMEKSLETDRVLLTALETLAFLLDFLVLQCFKAESNSNLWRKLLNAVMKSHYRSHNISKLLGALDVYRGLADVNVIKREVCVKVKSMLLHPFPKVRVAAAETLFLISGIEELKLIDWNQPASKLKEAVSQITLET